MAEAQESTPCRPPAADESRISDPWVGGLAGPQGAGAAVVLRHSPGGCERHRPRPDRPLWLSGRGVGRLGGRADKGAGGGGEHTALLLRLIPLWAGATRWTGATWERLSTASTRLRSSWVPIFLGPETRWSMASSWTASERPWGVRLVSEGSISACDINIRRILEEAVGLRASRLYLAHNHISNLAPSLRRRLAGH